MRPPLTKNKYGTIDKSIPVTTADKTKTNATGYALKQVPKKVKGKDWLDTVDDVMSAPQKAATYAIEAGLYKAGVRKDPPKYESPSDALGISEKDHPWIKMGTDMLLDPTNLLGIGIGKKIVSTYKDLKYLDKTDNVIKPLTNEYNNANDLRKVILHAYDDDLEDMGTVVSKITEKSIDLKNIEKAGKYNKIKNYHYNPDVTKSNIYTSLLLPVDRTVRKGQKAGVAIALTNDLINQDNSTQPTQPITSAQSTQVNMNNKPSNIQNNITTEVKKQTVNKDLKNTPKINIKEKVNSSKESSQKDTTGYVLKNNEVKNYSEDNYKINTPLEQPKKDTGKPDTYWLGDRWGSYNDLIQSNPRMKDPNLFYNTYKRKAPIDSTGTKTNLVIPKYQTGGLIKPYVTSDLKDFNKRTQQYNDSLNLYNIGNARAKLFDKDPGDPGLDKYNKEADKIVKRTSIKPTIARSSIYGDLPYPNGDIIWEEPYIAKFKKPTQKVVYAKPLDKISKMTSIELSSLPNNTTSEPQKRVVEPIKTIGKGYMDMRGQWLDNPATSFDYTPEQLEKMGYRKSTPKMKLGGEVTNGRAIVNRYDDGGEVEDEPSYIEGAGKKKRNTYEPKKSKEDAPPYILSQDENGNPTYRKPTITKGMADARMRKDNKTEYRKPDVEIVNYEKPYRQWDPNFSAKTSVNKYDQIGPIGGGIYQGGKINPYVAGSIGANNVQENDYVGGVSVKTGIAPEIRFGKNKQWEVSPSASVGYTKNFSKAYEKDAASGFYNTQNLSVSKNILNDKGKDNLQLSPYVSIGRTEGLGQTGYPLEAGLKLKSKTDNITSRLQAGLSYDLASNKYGVSIKMPINNSEKKNLKYKGNKPPTFAEGGEVPEYKKGGLIKRADGSYSKRGLWDNIRANRGSGKEPTPEMLEQERKIKNKYEDGGEIKKYKQGGEIKNSWLDKYEDGGPVVENQPQPQPLDSTTYENNIKNNYTSFLKNNPSVTLPKTVQNGDGMNCINGVCNLINASSGLELKGGQYATKVGKGKSYVGNASFNDASEKEGFYKLTNDDLNRDGFKPGDVVQYSKYKLNANRFDGKVNSNNAFDLYPQHAKIIVDKYKKGADTYYKIVDNGGEESYRINEISEKDLMNHNKNGYNAGLGHNYAGLIVQRYNPNEVINRQNIEKSKKDIIKGINPHSKEYDTATLPNYKFNENSDNQGGKLGNELMSIYNKNYKQIGKSSNLSPDILNKLMLNQVGIAGQETKYGSDLGFVKNLIPDSMLDEARQFKRNFSNEDSWTKDYYQKHSNKPEFVKKYPSLSKFQNEISDKYGDKSGKDNYLYLHGARSKGVFQQKELSERGNYLVKDKNLSNLESQAVGSLALAVDNYHKLAAKYPNLKPDQLIDLVTLSHNAPGKAMIPEYVEYYLKNNDIDYVNKVKKLIPAIENNSSKQKINTSNNLLSNR